MSDENFLSRWSRRKRQTAVVEAPPQIEAAEPPAESPAAATGSEENQPDLASLPSLESITDKTDITAFLRKGIPQDLSRAALRRAWQTDPAIRDFIGLAENAWDFNDPTAMEGFGPLDYTEEQLATLVNRIVGGVRSVAEQAEAAIPEQADQAELIASGERGDASAEARLAEAVAPEAAPPVIAAAQPQAAESIDDEEPAARPRTHGSALPR